MLKKIQEQPSSRNLSSNIITASEPIIPDKIISAKYQSDPPKFAVGATEFDEYSDDLASLLAESDKQKQIGKVGTITKEADDAYKTAKALSKSKKLNVKGSGKFGGLASILGLGTALFAPESKASKVISGVAKAAEGVDPSTYLQEALNDPRNSVEAIKEFSSKKSSKAPEITNESISNVKKLLMGDSEIRETTDPMLREVAKDSGIRPERALKLLGEQETEDIEDMPKNLNYEDYLRKMKKDRGY